MKKFCYKNWVRWLAGFLCILTFNTMLISFVCVLYAEEMQMYDKDLEDIKEEWYADILSDYSIKAVTDYQDDFGMEELKDTNFRYGIIQSEKVDIEGLDLNDKSNYVVCNFDKEVSSDMLHVYSCNMGEYTHYSAGKNIWDNFYIYNNSYMEEETWYPIEACYYDRNRRQMYVFANGFLYQTPDVYILQDAVFYEFYEAETMAAEEDVAEGGEVDEVLIQEVPPVEMTPGDLTPYMEKSVNGDAYQWTLPELNVQVAGNSYFLSDISIVTTAELQTIGEIVGSDTEYYYGENGIYIREYEYVDTLPYYVLSYINEPLEVIGMDTVDFFNAGITTWFTEFDKQDMFCQITLLLNLFYNFRMGMYAIFMASMVVFLISLVILTIGAGHKKGNEEIETGFVDRIPFDVLSCIVVIGVACFVTLAVVMFQEGYIRMGLTLGTVLVLFSEWMCIAYYDSFVARIKIGKWWRTTLCWKLWDFCWQLVKKAWNAFKGFWLRIAEAMPLLWKAVIVMLLLALFEFVSLAACSYNPGMQIFLWLVEKIVVYGFLLLFLLQMVRLKEAGEQLAKGEVHKPVNTDKMFLELKAHGENLNQIREGIGSAVEKQMKSERFKTELITNVSHDIKTPLTSIINYVDLLEKENIESPKAKEYLEVLSRQSIRLKKLIENLIEASKASTGNLTVINEDCNVCVMLTQTIGEFEEKLKAGEIDLIVQGNTIEAWIQADPRHLWRVFENLMNNICKYAQPHTRAYVNMERGENSVKIIFRNISKYALNMDSEALMERFVRGDSSRNTEGNGLGLSITQSLTELMQGKFELIVDGDLFKVILTFPMIEKTEAEIE